MPVKITRHGKYAIEIAVSMPDDYAAADVGLAEAGERQSQLGLIWEDTATDKEISND